MDVGACGPAQKLIPVVARGRRLVVDLHCHIGSPAAEAIVRDSGARPAPGSMPVTGEATREVNRRQFIDVAERLNGVQQRLADMDRLGVDVQAMSPSPGQYYYFTPPEVGRAAARAINERIAEAVAAHPDRLVGLGTVPLQAPEFAVAELRRCVRELDLRGVEICTNVNGKDL